MILKKRAKKDPPTEADSEIAGHHKKRRRRGGRISFAEVEAPFQVVPQSRKGRFSFAELEVPQKVVQNRRGKIALGFLEAGNIPVSPRRARIFSISLQVPPKGG